ncbi:hypothetical protein P5673_004269 [Acropora cervicornis]|uniref:Uncharacterized protein n=1 Tax=Acropora cervicornis TaxID=6130 RepID=A0AAD9VE14_ACRCE|nr:hypothetical protein P5673_004269 [Acropora cervicornis]
MLSLSESQFDNSPLNVQLVRCCGGCLCKAEKEVKKDNYSRLEDDSPHVILISKSVAISPGCNTVRAKGTSANEQVEENGDLFFNSAMQVKASRRVGSDPYEPDLQEFLFIHSLNRPEPCITTEVAGDLIWRPLWSHEAGLLKTTQQRSWPSY